jgi:hypothetical protein
MMPVTLPTTGWVCDRVEDARATGSTSPVRCGFCDRRLRWVHVLAHPDHAGRVGAGRCCAARLCGGYDAADAEGRLRSRLDRRARFVDLRGWTRSRSNPANVWRLVQIPGAKIRVVLFVAQDGRYGIQLTNLSARDERLFVPYRYDNRGVAAAVVFDAVEEVRAELAGES